MSIDAMYGASAIMVKMSIITMLETALTYKRLGVAKSKYDDINWYMILMTKGIVPTAKIGDKDNVINIIKNAPHDSSKVVPFEFDTLKYGTLPRPIHKSWS